ncbi:MAG TPA: hypothetical protein VN207_11190 [Ktedonobacteraceae bacterium]|nr:hypothetical protein [Ktedonobacteraceae bacterium]
MSSRILCWKWFWLRHRIFGKHRRIKRSLTLAHQDSIIYAALIADLKKQPTQGIKCFLSRDRKAFGYDDDRSIKDELGKYNCRYIGSFTQGLDFIKKAIDASRSTDNAK